MRKKNKIIILLFWLITSCTVGPDPETPTIAMPQSFTEAKDDTVQADIKNWWQQFQDPYLNLIIERALSNNYDLRIACEKIHEVRAIYCMEKADLMPHFDGFAQVEKEKRSKNFFETQFLGPIRKDYFHYGFDATWELDFFGKIRRSKQAAYFDVLSQIENSQDVQITLLSEVAKTYIEIRSLQHRCLLTKNIIKAQRGIYAFIQDKVQAGLSNSIELEQELSQLKSEEAILPMLLASLKSALYRLAFLMGQQPENLEKELVEIGSMPSADRKIPQILPSELLQRRPDIRKAEKDLYASIARVGSAKADLFPRFSLLGSWGFETDESSDVFKHSSQFWKIGPFFRWPILYFGKLRANLRAATSRQKQTLLKYEQTILGALKDVEISLSSYFQEEKRFTELSQKVQATQMSLSYYEDRFQSGLYSDLEVLEAKKTLYRSQKELIQCQESLICNLIALYKALGGDW